MSDSEVTSHRQQDLYLTEVYQLLVALDYMRRYRIFLARRVTWFGTLRAVASSTAIGAWAVWQSYPMIWGGIIATAQVADALKDVFPFTARHRAANDLVVTLEALRIEGLYEAERVYAGQFTDDEITELRRKLMRLRHEAEVKYFPLGNLPERKDLVALADEAATSHLIFSLGRGPTHDQESRGSPAPYEDKCPNAPWFANTALEYLGAGRPTRRQAERTG